MATIHQKRYQPEPPDRAIRRIAREQLGVFTFSQAESVGLSPQSIGRRVTSGAFERLHRGVFRISGGPSSWEQRLLAACLLTNGVASHGAAGRLLKLDGCQGSQPEISVFSRGRKSPPGLVIHRPLILPPCDVSSLGSIPITTCTRTLIDLGAVSEKEIVERALEDSLRRRLTSLEHLSARIAALEEKGRAGVGVIKTILSERTNRKPVESLLELRFLKLLKDAGLATPITQYEVFDGERLVARVDFAFPEKKIIIETDGFAYHSSPRELERDRSRRNELTALGWRVHQITWRQVNSDSEATVKLLSRLWLGSGSP